ncbi:hypothetical protein OFD51_32525, partial [Escherichia coli]|nr:hypothetical protein [Escherichia coli]
RTTPGNPLFIYRTDPAKAIANSQAAAIAGLKTDSAGTFNGEISGNELAALRSKVPQDHTRDWPAIIETASNYAAAYGITSVQDTHS